MMTLEERMRLFVKCPKCGHEVQINDNEVHDVWSAFCGNPGCSMWHGEGMVHTYLDYDDDAPEDAAYRELARQWNARAAAWRMMHENETAKGAQ